MNSQFIIGLLALLLIGAGTVMVLKKPAFLFGGEHHESEQVAAHEIYPGDVADKITNKENMILLDVRTPEEYEELHLKDALLLPVQELSQTSLNNIGLGAEAKDAEIILYCRSGARSKTAYDIMKSLGYTNIKSVAGGMIHWEEDEYPHTESGPYKGTLPSTQGTPSPSGGAKITFSRTSHDFGVIPQFGGVVKTGFIVQNTGTETLKVRQLSTSCSCTTAEITKTSIEPGGKSTLTVIFDPDFHEEPLDVFKRTVFIPTNDPNQPEAEVSITVDIAEGE